jgi:hypothetical protein
LLFDVYYLSRFMIGKLMRKTLFLTRLVFFISLTIVLEMVGLPQPITGPIINMMLFLTVMILSRAGGITLGSLTPILAVLRGQLPAILVPFVPFIIIGNGILVIVYFYFNNNALPGPGPIKSVRHWIGIGAAAVVKFSWLFISAKYVLPIIFGKSLPPIFITMMSLPQLFTALIGGILATLVYQFLCSANIIRSKWLTVQE